MPAGIRFSEAVYDRLGHEWSASSWTRSIGWTLTMSQETPRDTPSVRDNAAAHRYEVTIDGQASVLEYERVPGAITLNHTEVPVALRGRGLAKALAKAALDDALAKGDRVIPRCPFVRSYVRKHPEYESLVQR